MGKVIPFIRRSNGKIQVDNDLTGMLKEIVEVGKRSIGEEVNGVFQMNMSFEDMLKARIGSFIIDKKLINAELFRCSYMYRISSIKCFRRTLIVIMPSIILSADWKRRTRGY